MNGPLENARAITKQRLCDNFRPEVASDVIFDVDVEQVSMNARVKFGELKPFSTYTTVSLCTNDNDDNDDADRRSL